ncbi:hypothetical protein M0804_008823 [Polistes exclamans]|nr:hypothetical protein M0804_008823 [Polistes exclamans]
MDNWNSVKTTDHYLFNFLFLIIPVLEVSAMGNEKTLMLSLCSNHIDATTNKTKCEVSSAIVLPKALRKTRVKSWNRPRFPSCQNPPPPPSPPPPPCPSHLLDSSLTFTL